ncbi:DNA repair exonuclease SbcCD ATPase subunit [Albidovulum inexpectatum]|uniref:DNA repair exonuclease SbcCD ATPase subunit n=1 Tax=Albidovulum inexpectatum TaxID=196587 RepID=A0A2S5JHV5_9RHOB|nr:AAA family ATPase [Albidovulum inexpectatum]PPB80938.1 DNA repair exonuclease SbcCD ATPase subunit [Albidovulum inexpectatum]
MRITAIELRNVRRFVDPARIEGIGPGLNVLTAPNEAGKSTFFDALHAAFFLSHRSWDAVARGLQPKAGGDPEVEVAFEADGRQWTIRKVWSSSAGRKSARLTCDGAAVAEGEAAETRLAELLGLGKGGAGPAGLLWVRQGLVGEPVEKKIREVEEAARRDIMTEVAGEVELMTGGRRLERALAACETFLSSQLTGSQKKARAGSDLARTEAEVESLQARERELAERADKLARDLERRRAVRAELATLEDPQAQADLRKRLAEAEAALAEARERSGQIETAERTLAELDARLSAHKGQAEALRAALTERAEADAALKRARMALAEAQEAALAASKDHQAAESAHRLAEAAHRKARDVATRVLRAEAARSAESRRRELIERIGQAESLRGQIEALEARLAALPQAAILTRAVQAHQELQAAEVAHARALPGFTVRRAPAARAEVMRDGQPVPDGTRQILDAPVTLEIEGVGRIELDPGELAGDAALDQVRDAAGKALAATGLSDLAEIHRAMDQRAALDADLRDAKARLAALAPKGMAELRRELASLPEPAEGVNDLPDRATAERDLADAERALDRAAEALAAARARRDATQQALARAEAQEKSARERMDRAKAALRAEDPEAELARLDAEIATLGQAAERARVNLADLRRNAPDLAMAEARAERARAAIENVRHRSSELKLELAALDTRIDLESGEGIEEQLAFCRDKLDRVRDRLDRLRFEIAVHQRLRDALRAAQDAAREAYVAPVLRELVPLVRMIWPDAEPEIDAETGMIRAIRRRGEAEDYDILSGGTREQLSLLVRLAFARLLAQKGRPAPVILDDAIVYTDDQRIEQMFDALTRQAQDLQILVFSCRQRAFMALGGTAIAISRPTVA